MLSLAMLNRSCEHLPRPFKEFREHRQRQQERRQNRWERRRPFRKRQTPHFDSDCQEQRSHSPKELRLHREQRSVSQ